jgi:ribonuclease E
MLFNATQAEELRVAIVDGQKLIDLDIETTGKEQRKGNIYKGVITRIEPGLEAAFVNYGAERHGFLPFKEVSRTFFQSDVDPGRARIQDVMREGQELIVQVDKDERGNKGAALTTFISLAGRYLVLMPNNPRGGGVSRRVEGEERNELRDLIASLEVPSGMSIIARTAGLGRSLEELQWDLNYLLQLWRAIENASRQQSGAFLIYQESSLVIRAIRDYFHQEIGELLIDTEAVYEQARQFMAHVMPGNVNRVKMYKDDVPLFSRFQIEHQIETAYSRQVALPSGGAIVIDHTEAMVTIDVNSARSTRGADIEETALRTNLEAADEIARQLRLRDLGGLVVIDFIDMESARNQREVENRLRDALRYDRARVQMGKISRFGLMELSRQRLQTSLGETSHMSCPRCHGTGHIRSVESSALHILRILQEEAMKENTAAVHAQVPVDVATFLLNEKRSEFHAIEQRLKVSIVLIPNIHLETPNYALTRLRHDELNQMEPLPASYRMMDQPAEPEKPAVPGAEVKPPSRPQAAVQGITPEQPAPVPVAPAEPPKPSILQKIFGWLTRKPEEKPEPVKTRPREQRRPAGERGRHERRGRDEQGARRHGQAEGARPPQQPRRDRGERGERAERIQQRGQPQAGSRPAKAEHVAQGDTRPAASEQRGERQERADRGERRERAERPDRQDRQDRPGRPERPRGESGAQEAGEGRGRRRRGRRERGGRAEGETARPEAESVRPELAVASAQPSPVEFRPEPEDDERAAPLSEPVAAEHVAIATADREPTPVQPRLPEAAWMQPVAAEPVAPTTAVAVPPHPEPEAAAPLPRYERVEEAPEVAPTTAEAVPPHSEPEAAAPPRYERVEEAPEVAPAPPQPEPTAYRATALSQAYAMPPDMVQVETTHAAAPPEPEVQPEGLPRRPRRALAEESAAENEPLVQVETRPATSGSE